MSNILLIDDDERLADLLSDFFSNYDLQLDSVHHPMEGVKKIETNPTIDLVILDVMLPSIDGFETCKRIRQNSQVPILMLTARGDVMDKVVGLEIGADDYLAKPFEPRELVARVKNIIKRSQKKSPIEKSSLIQIGELTIHPEHAEINQQTLSLTGKEFTLLRLLAESPNQYLSRDDIMHMLNGIDRDYFSRSIDMLVSRLRYKIKPLNYIKTVHGKGYRISQRR